MNVVLILGNGADLDLGLKQVLLAFVLANIGNNI